MWARRTPFFFMQHASVVSAPGRSLARGASNSHLKHVTGLLTSEIAVPLPSCKHVLVTLVEKNEGRQGRHADNAAHLLELGLGKLCLAQQAAHLAQAAPKPLMLAIRVRSMLFERLRQGIALRTELVTKRVLSAKSVLERCLPGRAAVSACSGVPSKICIPLGGP